MPRRVEVWTAVAINLVQLDLLNVWTSFEQLDMLYLSRCHLMCYLCAEVLVLVEPVSCINAWANKGAAILSGPSEQVLPLTAQAGLCEDLLVVLEECRGHSQQGLTVP